MTGCDSAPNARTRVCVGLLLVFICPFLLSSQGRCAETRTFVTKAGDVFVGEVVMEGENAVAIRTAGGMVTVRKSELLNVSPEEAAAWGLLLQGKQSKAEADKAYEAGDLGAASYQYETTLERLKAVPSDAAEPAASAQALVEQVEARAEQIRSSLAERGLAAYRGQLFEKAVLDYHLGNGHMLVGKATWVEPSQICSRCMGKQRIACETCSGHGKMRFDCPYCTAGLAPNPVGNGTGIAVCSGCAGNGQVGVTCPTCRGSGQTRCATCRGKGTVREKCKACNGKGHIRKRVKYPGGTWRVESIDCTACGRTGRVDVKCKACGGTGHLICSRCRGQKQINVRCPRCGGKGKMLVAKTIPCTHCHFGWIEKTCEICRGMGYVPCPDCGGVGYTGDPIPDPDTSKLRDDTTEPAAPEHAEAHHARNDS
jgi:hypothetical protein